VGEKITQDRVSEYISLSEAWPAAAAAAHLRLVKMEMVYTWSTACLLLFVTLLDSVICFENDVSVVRVHEKMFDESTQLGKYTVTCENVKSDAKFPSATWSCHNIRINGKKLRHLFQYHESHCVTDKKSSAEKFDGKNDIAELCRKMMKAHGVHAELWSAFVHKPKCGNKKESMMIFTPVDDRNYQWNETVSKGYATTIRCMAVN